MQQYADETKAQVIAEWKAGATLKGLEREHGIPESTIRGWTAGHTRVVVAPKNNGLAAYDLDAMAVGLVNGSVQAVGAIAGITQDKAWLQRQNAADLAILYGVITDKLYRLLHAIRTDEQQSPAANA